MYSIVCMYRSSGRYRGDDWGVRMSECSCRSGSTELMIISYHIKPKKEESRLVAAAASSTHVWLHRNRIAFVFKNIQMTGSI
jgi:hypothetical protein